MIAEPEKVAATHLQELVSALGATEGTQGRYQGMVENVPFMLQVITAEPPTYIFRFRMMEPRTEFSQWQEEVKQMLPNLDVTCKMEGNYLWLWVHKATELSAEQIRLLAVKCVRDHAAVLPQNAGYCYQCGNTTGETTLVQAGDDIAALCPGCIEKRAETQAQLEHALRRFSWKRAALVPAALAVGGLGWGAFWVGFEKVTEMAGGEIRLPQFVVLLLVVAVAYGTTWPVGKLLQSSGLVIRVPRMILMVGVTLATVLAGEFLFCSYLLFEAFHIFNPMLTVLTYTSVLGGADASYYVLKALFTGGVGWAIFQMTAPKQVVLGV